MLLRDWMRLEGISDAAMASRLMVSEPFVKKLRFRQRGASLATAARIEEVTQGRVRAADLLPRAPSPAPAPAEAST